MPVQKRRQQVQATIEARKQLHVCTADRRDAKFTTNNYSCMHACMHAKKTVKKWTQETMY